MSVKVGDLVRTKMGVVVPLGTASLKGIVYEADGSWVHIMWSDGRRTTRLSDGLEVISGT